MFKNYFYLNRCVVELNSHLKNVTIQEIFTQERDKLFLHAGDESYPDRHIIISTDPSASYVSVKNEHHKAKKNRINFFESFLPDRINKIFIASNDRVIKIELSKSSIYFFVRGSSSNILLVNDEGQIHEFKKVKNINHIELRNELEGLDYIDNFNNPELITQNMLSDKKNTPHISKELKIEAESRGKISGSDEFNIEIDNIINEIFEKNISVFYSDEFNKPILCPDSFTTFQMPDDSRKFIKYNDALSFYLALKYRNEKLSLIKNEIEKYLSREIEKLSNKLNELKNRLERGSKEEIYRHNGELLLNNLHSIKKGMEEIELSDYITNENVKIKLDPKKSPQKMVDYYFDKSRGERINYGKSETLFNQSQSRYNFLITIKEKYESAETLEEFAAIKKELKLGTKDKLVKNIEQPIRYRHFIIDNKYHVYVGKDNANNDLLTFKFAKQNDYWFHARSVSGSHVVLRVDNPKEGIPKNILKNTASIAAFYSKSKTSGTAPVTYTFRKYVHKKKGLAPGKVMISKENVLLVKPEIPKNCEHVED